MVELSAAALLSLIAGAGALLLTVQLLASENASARRFSIFTGLFSFTLMHAPLGDLHILPPLWGHLKPISLLTIPALFLYARKVMSIGSHVPWLHAFPALLLLIVDDEPNGLLYNIQVLQVFLYLPLLLWMIHAHQKRLDHAVSEYAGNDLAWLAKLCILLLILVGMDFLLFPLFHSFGLGLGAAQTALNFLGTLVVLWLARAAARQHFVKVVEPEKKAYETSVLDTETLQNLANQVTRTTMMDGLHLIPGLTLKQLADANGMSLHVLSEVLNRGVGKSFYEFINGKRIQIAKDRLVQTDKRILEIAFEVGFTNKASFNQAFKKITGTTPRAYRQQEKSKPRSS